MIIPHATTRKCAFTLVELLVVMAVIGVLAALLLPVLSSAKRRTRQAGCINNLRQLTLANFMVAADTDHHATYDNPENPHTLWMGEDAYAKQRKILICPSTHERSPVPNENTFGTADLTWVWTDAVTNIYTGSYALNGWLYDTVKFGAEGHPEYMMSKQSLIERPTQTPVFCDSVWTDLWPLESDLPRADLYNGAGEETGMTRSTIVRHGGNPGRAPRDFDISQKMPGAINIGAADGHVEIAKLEDLWQYYWHRNWNPPAIRPR